MSVSLDHVITAVRSGAASLAAELSGYIVLEAADQVAHAPCQLHTSGVELGSEGDVRVSAGRAVEDITAEGSLRRLLSQLLDVARSGSPALQRASRRPVGQGVAALAGELEAALVPVNRGAARRALARLHRETVRVGMSGMPEFAQNAVNQPEDETLHLEVRSTKGSPESNDRTAVRGMEAAEESSALSPFGVSLGPDEAKQSTTEQTDRMETGHGSLPSAIVSLPTGEPTCGDRSATRSPTVAQMSPRCRSRSRSSERGAPALIEQMRPPALHGEASASADSLHSDRCSRESDGRTPRLGSMAVSVSSGTDDARDQLSRSDVSVPVNVDEPGDETPLLSRPDVEASAPWPPSPPAVEKETADAAEADEAGGREPACRPSVLPTIPAPDPGPAGTVPQAAIGSQARVSSLETLVRGFTAGESRSVRDLCRELQEIAGLEGRDGQSSLPPPATTDKAVWRGQ